MTDVPPGEGEPAGDEGSYVPSGRRRSTFTPPGSEPSEGAAPESSEPNATVDDDALADALAAQVAQYTSPITLPTARQLEEDAGSAPQPAVVAQQPEPQVEPEPAPEPQQPEPQQPEPQPEPDTRTRAGARRRARAPQRSRIGSARRRRDGLQRPAAGVPRLRLRTAGADRRARVHAGCRCRRTGRRGIRATSVSGRGIRRPCACRRCIRPRRHVDSAGER